MADDRSPESHRSPRAADMLALVGLIVSLATSGLAQADPTAALRFTVSVAKSKGLERIVITQVGHDESSFLTSVSRATFVDVTIERLGAEQTVTNSINQWDVVTLNRVIGGLSPAEQRLAESQCRYFHRPQVAPTGDQWLMQRLGGEAIVDGFPVTVKAVMPAIVE